MAPASPFSEAFDMDFDFKRQHDFDLHIALEVSPGDLEKMFAKGKAEGVETRGISDHHIINSIYFRDPNGYVVELTAKTQAHDAAMNTGRDKAEQSLKAWQARKAAQAEV
jgi:catechol-2,3-dioxygenase